jgi:uncharacterized membrane protein YczE
MALSSSANLLADLSPIAQLPAGHLPERTARLLVGLWLYGASIALMVEGALGSAPWDVLHLGASEHLPAGGLGTTVVATSVVVLLAWIPLRQMPGLGTILNAALVGPFADLGLAVLPTPDHLVAQVGYLIGGIVSCSFATALYVGAQLGPGPRDGLMTGLARSTGWSVRSVRTGIELAVLSTGVLLGGIAGLGTIGFALAVGPLTQHFLRFLVVPLDGGADARLTSTPRAASLPDGLPVTGGR